MSIEIKHKITGKVLWTVDADHLTGADLTGAILRWANLTGADLTGADLTRADLSSIKSDFSLVLDAAPSEIPALLTALQAGKIDGQVYTGECACLVGTIANARGCSPYAMPGLMPNGGRPAERWFLAIKPGDTPDSNPVSKITEGWILEWQAAGTAEKTKGDCIEP